MYMKLRVTGRPKWLHKRARCCWNRVRLGLVSSGVHAVSDLDVRNLTDK